MSKWIADINGNLVNLDQAQALCVTEECAKHWLVSAQLPDDEWPLKEFASQKGARDWLGVLAKELGEGR